MYSFVILSNSDEKTKINHALVHLLVHSDFRTLHALSPEAHWFLMKQ